MESFTSLVNPMRWRRRAYPRAALGQLAWRERLRRTIGGYRFGADGAVLVTRGLRPARG
jgi:hypothetical protein